jgi:hypothetical protein
MRCMTLNLSFMTSMRVEFSQHHDDEFLTFPVSHLSFKLRENTFPA